jgi:hypothetical protein
MVIRPMTGQFPSLSLAVRWIKNASRKFSFFCITIPFICVTKLVVQQTFIAMKNADIHGI